MLFAICWIVGSSTACLYTGHRLGWIGVGLTLILLSAMVLFQERWRTIVMIWSTLILSAGYWEWHDYSNVTTLPEVMQQEVSALAGIVVQAEGRVTTAVEVDGDRVNMNIDLSEVNSSVISEKVLVQVKLLTEEEQQEAMRWQRGDLVKMTATLEIPAISRNFDGFDYRNYLRTREIHWILKVNGLDNVELIPPSSWSLLSLFRLNDVLREKIGTKIEALFQEPHAGYMKGLIIGMQDDVDPTTYSQFSQLGLTHILAVSGTHVAVYVACLLILLSLFRLTRETKLTIVILLVPCYVLLTGFSPSVVRSGIMSMIALYAARQGLLKDGLHIISAAALFMLLWNPYLLVNVSFQLSFIVTLGLMVYVPLIMPMLSKLPRKFAPVLGVTVIAQFVSFPLTIYYFNQFSLLSVVANLLLVPLISFVVLPLGMVSLVLGILWMPLGKGLAWVAQCLDNVTFTFVEWMNLHQAFITIWPSPSILWICCYYILLYVLLRLIKIWIEYVQPHPIYIEDTIPLDDVLVPHQQLINSRSRKLTWRQYIVAPLVFTFVILLYLGYQSESLNGAGLVSFVDVGQGDCILITTPEGKHILVDGGGTINFRKPEDYWKNRKDPFEVGAKVVVPLLKKRGVHQLDAVILTHGDQDHMGGLQAVLDDIPVKAFLFNGTLTGAANQENLLSTVLAKDIPIYAIHNTMVLQLDGNSKLTFLSPEMTNEEQQQLPIVKEQNHSSLVFIVEMNGVRMLLTGDMDIASEMNILHDKFQTANVLEGVDIMKVAHHGSKTSTAEEWLSQWKAAIAVISAGVNNSYGHPHSDVVARITAQGMRIFRTDQQGEIQMKFLHDDVWVKNKLR
ncbi:DNA internalization-related competence protein ComEC/Rec2 [Paenibacillus crassostreae]|uniref:DNA internalization-related competence protein ComEC/Rec2 n=1 Tax=Paenibacillus crassostreae TaxID=1763538 RepID=UPI001E6206B5|nr:DNA internalization-related competence protein ComEC/Rec2 [Paenibacillus crassostreae]